MRAVHVPGDARRQIDENERLCPHGSSSHNVLERARPLCQNGAAISTRFGARELAVWIAGTVESKALHRPRRGALLSRQRHARGVSREDRQPRFAAEGAAHFRYTEMVAGGRAIPALDVRAQWPEGLRVFRETSPAMEYLFGWTYRLIPGGQAGSRLVRTGLHGVLLFARDSSARASLGEALEERSARGSSPRSSSPSRSRSSRARADSITSGRMSPCRSSSFHRSSTSRRAREAASRSRSSRASFSSRRSRRGTGRSSISCRFSLFVLARAIVAEAVRRETPRGSRSLVCAIAAAGAIVPFLREGRFLLSIPAALAAAVLAVDLLRRDRLGGGSRGARRGGAAAGRFPRGDAPSSRRPSIAAVLVPGAISGRHFASYSHFFDLVSLQAAVPREAGRSAAPAVRRAGLLGRAVQLPGSRSTSSCSRCRCCFSCRGPCRSCCGGPGNAISRRFSRSCFSPCFFCSFLLMQRLLPLFGFFAAIAAGGNAAELRHERGAAALRRPALFLSLVVVAVSLCSGFRLGGEARLLARSGAASPGALARGVRDLSAREGRRGGSARVDAGTTCRGRRRHVAPSPVPAVLAYDGPRDESQRFLRIARRATQGGAAARARSTPARRSSTGSPRSSRARTFS